MASSQGLRPRDFLAPTVSTIACPIRASLGVLGRKWSLLILRDIAFYRDVRFSDLLRSNRGLTPRVLAFRLKELKGEDFIRRLPLNGSRRDAAYELTQKGRDAVPILTAFVSFGIRYHADEVFADRKARTLSQLLPGAQCELLRGLEDYAKDGLKVQKT
jgi:DNA-binding HxlR family transcriptional regulator